MNTNCSIFIFLTTTNHVFRILIGEVPSLGTVITERLIILSMDDPHAKMKSVRCFTSLYIFKKDFKVIFF